MPDLRPDLDVVFGHALGAAATVTPPSGAAIPTRVVIHPPRYAELAPGTAQPIGEPIQELSLRRDEVPTMKRGTTIAVTEGPDAGTTYTVDSIASADAQAWRVVVR